MLQKIPLLLIFLSLNSGSYNLENTENLDICELKANSYVNNKNIVGDKRNKVIKALKLICYAEFSNGKDIQKDLIRLKSSIQILEKLSGVDDKIIEALELRIRKNIKLTFQNPTRIDNSACWDAIFDYTYLIELTNKQDYYLKRGNLYLTIEEYSKACNDFEIAQRNGSREAKNLMDKYGCY